MLFRSNSGSNNESNLDNFTTFGGDANVTEPGLIDQEAHLQGVQATTFLAELPQQRAEQQQQSTHDNADAGSRAVSTATNAESGKVSAASPRLVVKEIVQDEAREDHGEGEQCATCLAGLTRQCPKQRQQSNHDIAIVGASNPHLLHLVIKNRL